MLRSKSVDIINEVRETLKRNYTSFKGVYFFGSRVNDDYNEFSDYDLALIFEEEITWQFKDEIRNLIYDVMLNFDVVIDSHIFSKEQITNPTTPFRKNIKSEGLYYEV